MILVSWWGCVCVCCPIVVIDDAGVWAGWTSSECSCRYSSMTSRSTSGHDDGATALQVPRPPLSLTSVTYDIWQTQSRTAAFRHEALKVCFSLRCSQWWAFCVQCCIYVLSVSKSLRWCQTKHLLFDLHKWIPLFVSTEPLILHEVGFSVKYEFPYSRC